MQRIMDTIETLLCAFDSGFDNAHFLHKCEYVSNVNFTFWLKEDEKLDFNDVIDYVKKYNNNTDHRNQLFVRKVGSKLLFKFSSSYDCTG